MTNIVRLELVESLIPNRLIRDTQLFFYGLPSQAVKVHLSISIVKFRVKVEIIALLLNNSVYA